MIRNDLNTYNYPDEATDRENLREDEIRVILTANRYSTFCDSEKITKTAMGLNCDKDKSFARSVLEKHWPERVNNEEWSEDFDKDNLVEYDEIEGFNLKSVRDGGLTRIEQLSNKENVLQKINSERIKNAILIFRHIHLWSREMNDDGLILKREDDPDIKLAGIKDKVKNANPKKYKEAAKKLANLSDGCITFFQKEDSEYLCVHRETSFFNRITEKSSEISRKDIEKNNKDEKNNGQKFTPEKKSKSEKSGKGLYIMTVQDGLIKIGISNNPQRRLNSIQTSCPYEVSLSADTFKFESKKLEKELHRKYEQYKMNGEWFDIPTDESEELITAVENDNLEKLSY